MFPQSYDEWVKCITVGCQIQLEPTYIRERIEALRDPSDSHTKRYLKLYGNDHLERVIGWFERALDERCES